MRVLSKLLLLFDYARGIGVFGFGRFGRRSVLRKPLRIVGARYASIGERCVIEQGLRLECVDLWNERRFSPALTIGNRVDIGQNAHITCASSIKIGDDCSILPECLITDISHPYSDVAVAPKFQTIETKPVEIGEQTMIGMGARILPGVRIGRHCVIGANAVVTKDIPDYCVAVGIPATVIRTYDAEKREWLAKMRADYVCRGGGKSPMRLRNANGARQRERSLAM